MNCLHKKIARGELAVVGSCGRNILLDQGRTAAIKRVRRGERIVCARGKVWITLRGDREDRVLAANETLDPTTRRGIVIYALVPSEVWVLARRGAIPSAEPGPARLRGQDPAQTARIMPLAGEPSLQWKSSAMSKAGRSQPPR